MTHWQWKLQKLCSDNVQETPLMHYDYLQKSIQTVYIGKFVNGKLEKKVAINLTISEAETLLKRFKNKLVHGTEDTMFDYVTYDIRNEDSFGCN